MFGAISEKFRTSDIQIIFAISPISHFFKVMKFLSLYQSTCCVIIRHFTTVPTLFASNDIQVHACSNLSKTFLYRT